MSVNVIVAEDHPVSRHGVVHHLSNHPDINVVQDVETTDAALKETFERKPDVLILDVNMPGDVKSLDVVSQIKESDLDTKVLIVSAHREMGIILTFVRAEADGYLLKDEDLEVLTNGVLKVARGEGCWSDVVADTLAQYVKSKPVSNIFTHREVDVLGFVAQGLTNTAIADHLNLSERTIEFHIENIREKINASNKKEVIAWVQRFYDLVE